MCSMSKFIKALLPYNFRTQPLLYPIHMPFDRLHYTFIITSKGLVETIPLC